jgi:hypothetical protein
MRGTISLTDLELIEGFGPVPHLPFRLRPRGPEELRCEQCQAGLLWEHVDRARGRFCCSDCLAASFRGLPRASTPHDHIYS